jgi:hypothetical protein
MTHILGAAAPVTARKPDFRSAALIGLSTLQRLEKAKLVRNYSGVSLSGRAGVATVMLRPEPP